MIPLDDPSLATSAATLASYAFGLAILAVVVPIILVVGAFVTLPPLFRLMLDVLAIFETENPSIDKADTDSPLLRVDVIESGDG